MNRKLFPQTLARVFHLFFAAALALGVASVPVMQAGADTPVLDQSFTAGGNMGASINDCCKFVGQTFTAGLTGTLAGINIDVSSTSSFPLHVAIRTVTPGGVPSSMILGETTLSSSSAPLSLLITFPQTINIFAGVQYAIVVNYEGAPPPGAGQGQGVWTGVIGDPYPGGRGYDSFSDGISWRQIAVPDGDLHFQTYVTVAPFEEVGIDIKPGKGPNRIEIEPDDDEKKKIQVAILSTAQFDAPQQVDKNSLTFGHSGDEDSLHRKGRKGTPDCRTRDVNHDGLSDLVCRFLTQKTGFQLGDTVGILKGQTVEGVPIEGRDAVVIVVDD